ncbi:MAG: CmcJ/NvfI family oxidoreductase [Rhodobacteraceae bacterium]|nr:CmcJ/NvfI family oxidoreductase [Paracoccaceae bacterium]
MGIPLFPDTPFIVSESLFVKPGCRGFRLPYLAEKADRMKMLVIKPIRVHDARELSQVPTIRRMGFELVHAPINVDYGDHGSVISRFYDQCAELVMEATGCISARTMQHEFRVGAPVLPGGAGTYAQLAHADLTPYVEDVLDIPDGCHFGVYNVWRSTDRLRPIESKPLAICDSSTISADDMISADGWRLTEPRTRLVLHQLVYDTAQCWYYFPKMESDEALIFRQYDSRIVDPVSRVTFHTAFNDPTTRDDAPRRRSVEARVFAIFAEGDPAERKSRYQAEIPTLYPDGRLSSWRYERMIDWGIS